MKWSLFSRGQTVLGQAWLLRLGVKIDRLRTGT